MDSWKNFFMERAVKHWDGLPMEVLEPPPLEVIKKSLNVALGALL